MFNIEEVVNEHNPNRETNQERKKKRNRRNRDIDLVGRTAGLNLYHTFSLSLSLSLSLSSPPQHLCFLGFSLLPIGMIPIHEVGYRYGVCFITYTLIYIEIFQQI